MPVDRNGLLALCLMLLACTPPLYCFPPDFSHPYLQHLYNKSNDEFGRARPEAPADQSDVWGFLDNGADTSQAITPLSPCEQLMSNSIPTTELAAAARTQNSLLKKILWLFYVKHKANFDSPSCGQLEIEAAFTMGEQTHRLVQPLLNNKIGVTRGSWVFMNVSSALGNLSSIPDQLYVDTRLRCRRCLPGSALPLELVDVRSTHSYSKGYRQKRQPLLALHFKARDLFHEDSILSQRQKRTVQKLGTLSIYEVPKTFPFKERTPRPTEAVTAPPTTAPEPCTKHTMNVAVADLQLYPSGTPTMPVNVNIGRCAGKCLRQYGMMARYRDSLLSDHALIKLRLLAMEKQPSTVVEVHCVPLSYNTVGLMVWPSPFFQRYEHHPGYSVRECGCR